MHVCSGDRTFPDWYSGESRCLDCGEFFTEKPSSEPVGASRHTTERSAEMRHTEKEPTTSEAPDTWKINSPKVARKPEPDGDPLNPWNLDEPELDTPQARLLEAVREFDEQHQAVELSDEEREQHQGPDTYGIFEESRR